jgi:transposase
MPLQVVPKAMVKVKLTADEIPDDLGTWEETLLRQSGWINELEEQLKSLLKTRYGPKSESISPNQLRLFGEQEQLPAVEEPEEEPTTVVHTSKRSRRNAGKELARRRILHEPSDAELTCSCGERKVRIGEEVTERLDYVPSSVFVNEHVRGKYACKNCQGEVVIGPKPAQLIERGFVEAGLLAYIATSKYADHLPLHRLEGMFRRQGANISRPTMCDWLISAGKALVPLHGLMVQRVLRSRIVWTDDTPVKMQDRELEKKLRETRIWTYLGDRDNPYVVFDFTKSRKRDGPAQFLKGYKGYLQADAFAGYDCIFSGGEVIEVACIAQVRRKFFEALTSSKEAQQALAIIQDLYLIEKNAKELESVPGYERKTASGEKEYVAPYHIIDPTRRTDPFYAGDDQPAEYRIYWLNWLESDGKLKGDAAAQMARLFYRGREGTGYNLPEGHLALKTLEERLTGRPSPNR